MTGRCLAQLVEKVSHIQRLFPRCGPGLEPRPGALCHVLLPLTLILSPVVPSAVLSIKLIKAEKYIYTKKDINDS